jgi:hypothetical protein
VIINKSVRNAPAVLPIANNLTDDISDRNF